AAWLYRHHLLTNSRRNKTHHQSCGPLPNGTARPHANEKGLMPLVPLKNRHKTLFDRGCAAWLILLPAEPSCSQASTIRLAIRSSADLPQAPGSYCFFTPTSPSTLSTPS